VRKSDPGVTCSAGNQCGSGFCADSRCCTTACTGDCESCNGSGVCTKAAAQTDPRNKCGLYTCSAAGSCAASCAPTTCGGDNCKDTATCSASVCVAKKSDGTSCTTACECRTGACSTYYVDVDGDGYGVGAGALQCGRTARGHQALVAGDCNDNNLNINPAAEELLADGVDQDCNGTEKCYLDADQDGYRGFYLAVKESRNLLCTDSGYAPASLPGGDRCETSFDTNPGQTGWFDKVNECGTFDWDSDGNTEAQYKYLFSCPPQERCVAGWTGLAPPKCGQAGNFRTCASGCTLLATVVTQLCR